MSSILLKVGAAAGIGAFVETKYGPSVLLHTSTGLSPLSAATPLILVGVGFWTLVHGFEMGKARTKYIELAKKDGEENVEERYNLPNLYAQGTSKYVKALNAIQRSHQQIFETFSAVVISGLMGAVEFPITTALSTLGYAVGRIILSTNYAASDGDVAKRYSNKLATCMWYGIIGNFCLGAASCIKILSTTRLAVAK
mmetsp:Transcript_21726/g.28090  ORF Transcript_21726/g.28090 Transcript_21726/m.28090 type:complete len:197 (-) Transcript_21726:157-747(-)|eukprot:CAMPEP_0198143220 /NCGR_PEP_ID=MMETSP1443-20131203/6079_1 /TAXON_ID=186043 /ORGANISM="Entomoneis sp., Strain CCMP2396" /LENGTH=196 /DNA_ID=CAMNT_0043806411 /DNA_START=30 /DNA_END=620 /DNA_ORIENTATION=-